MDTELMWIDARDGSDPCSHYSVMKLSRSELGMAALRRMFPTAQADEMNFVLFSTSGVHGSYDTIEDVLEERESGNDEAALTFLIVQPRLVSIRYGKCIPETEDDFQYLRRLRETSSLEASLIGH